MPKTKRGPTLREWILDRYVHYDANIHQVLVNDVPIHGKQLDRPICALDIVKIKEKS